MPRFSRISAERLLTCHPDLIAIFNEVVKHVDISIVCGHRGEKEQNEAFNSGHSQRRYPNSFHNYIPSVAIDVMLWHQQEPHVRWDDIVGAAWLAGYVQRIADELGVGIRFGGNWDGDDEFDDNTFNDYAHYELTSGFSA